MNNDKWKRNQKWSNDYPNEQFQEDEKKTRYQNELIQLMYSSFQLSAATWYNSHMIKISHKKETLKDTTAPKTRPITR
jgi:hypothetical protein